MGLFDLLKKESPPKTVVIGLDGVPHSLLNDLVSQGYLRNLAAIFKNGYYGKMEVCLPEISSVSWSSFMTGTQAGEHGIFGFVDLQPNTYRFTFPNFLNLRGKTLFDEFGDTNRRCVVINLPSTYPVREIPGILIAGFVAIDLSAAVYPKSLIPRLQEMGYSIDIDTVKAREDHDLLFRDLSRTLQVREQLADYLWSDEDWDLFMVVITGTDRLNHFLWNAYEDQNHPRHEDFINYYQMVDQFVGRTYEKFLALQSSGSGENHFVMLSDHGFEGIRSEVYLNEWLQQEGLLSFGSKQPESLEDISAGSKAFALDPSRIYINSKGRYPQGSVQPEDVVKIKEEIRSGLKDLTFEDGLPVVQRIFDGEEIYQGPLASQGPDLVLLSNSGFDLKGKLASPTLFGRTGLQGKHTHDDAFVYSSKGKEAKTIFELKRLILDER